MKERYQDPPKSKRAKDTFYFSHDVNSHRDPKIARLHVILGHAGKGIFWDLVELLHEQRNAVAMRDECDRNAVAMLLQCDRATLDKFLHVAVDDCHLFELEDGVLSSERVARNLDQQESKSKKAKQNAELRWGKEPDAVAMRPQCDRNANKIKENKIKEKKIYIEAAPHVRMTQPELDVIKNEHGEAWANQFIKAVSDYQASTGKRYKDFPATARTWKAREIQRANSAPISRPPGERPPMNIDLDAVVDPFQSLKDRENEKKSKLEALQNRRH